MWVRDPVTGNATGRRNEKVPARAPLSHARRLILAMFGAAGTRVRWARAACVSAAVHLGALTCILRGATPRGEAIPDVAPGALVVVDLVASSAPERRRGSSEAPARGGRARRARIEPMLARAPTLAVDDRFVPAFGGAADVAGGPAAWDGPGGDGGAAASGTRGRPRELVARVVGSGSALAGRVGEGAPVVSLDEATALRIRDYFPRLPAAKWPEFRAYIVRVGLCVSDGGKVTEAVLQSSASPALDPLVLAAVRSWRYRPRMVDGEARPFCHAVTIAYERAY
jgi:TonB family protein